MSEDQLEPSPGVPEAGENAPATARNRPSTGHLEGAEISLNSNGMDGPCPSAKNRETSSVSLSLKGALGEKEEPAGRAVKVGQYEANGRLGSAQLLNDLRTRKKDLPTLYPASYEAWQAMTKRHSRKTHEVCDRWRGKSGFANFLEDLGAKYLDGLSLDRLDNPNRSYFPGGVEWGGAEQQNNNRSTTIKVHDPETGTEEPLAPTCRKYGLSYEAAKKRLGRGIVTTGNVIHTMREELRTRQGVSPRGRAILTPPAPEPAPQVAPPISAPAVAEDPRFRWPWPLTREQHDAWEAQYREHRQPLQDSYGDVLEDELGEPVGYEWRYHCALRTTRQARDQFAQTLHRLAQVEDIRPLSPEEEDLWQDAENKRAHYERRYLTALDGLRAFEDAIRGYPRDRYSHYRAARFPRHLSEEAVTPVHAAAEAVYDAVTETAPEPLPAPAPRQPRRRNINLD